MWTTPTDLLLIPRIGLRTCIAECMGDIETPQVLDNSSIMDLAWCLCGSCSINFHNHRYHKAHCHLSGSEHYRALVFQYYW